MVIRRLEEQIKVNNCSLIQIKSFIEPTKNQAENTDLNDETRLEYLDLVEEESLRDKIQEDLMRNYELIASIKKSIDALFY